MKSFFPGVVCGALVALIGVVYIEFTQESTGGISPYIDDLLDPINDYLASSIELPPISEGLPTLEGEQARVLRVVDGDTIDVEINGERQRVRYIGMNTPERDEPCYDEATEADLSPVIRTTTRESFPFKLTMRRTRDEAKTIY